MSRYLRTARIAVVWSLLGAACSGGASANPCEVLKASEVEAALGVVRVRPAESPVKGFFRTCGYRVAGGWSAREGVPKDLALELSISDVKSSAEDERTVANVRGQRDVFMPGVDRARVVTGAGAVSASLSMVEGDRSATLFFWLTDQSDTEQQRILEDLATIVRERWLSEQSR